MLSDDERLSLVSMSRLSFRYSREERAVINKQANDRRRRARRAPVNPASRYCANAVPYNSCCKALTNLFYTLCYGVANNRD